MASAIGLRQAFPTHTNRTLFRFERRAPESAVCSFFTVRSSRRPLPDSSPPQRGRENVHARLYRSEEHTSELQSRLHLVCRLLLEKKKKKKQRLISMQNILTVVT